MPIKRRTKIVATIGPASETPKMIATLLEGGVNLCRFNLKHNTQKWHQDKIRLVRTTAKKMGLKVGVMVDIPRFDFEIEFNDWDYLALSYVKNFREIISIKKRFGSKNVKVIAKIENQRSYDGLGEIIDVSDGVMVARGDLGKEVKLSHLGMMQKRIIDLCRQNSCPVIVATEMLFSMVDNSRPTRAEATDVANAVFDGADCLMLSDETAIGKFGPQAVETMNDIISYSEGTGELRQINIPLNTLTDRLIGATADIIQGDGEGKIKAVMVFTKTGKTAMRIAKYRLDTPIIAVTDEPQVVQWLTVVYGTSGYYNKFAGPRFAEDERIYQIIKNMFGLTSGQTILVVQGNNWLKSGSTNQISLRQL